MTQSSSSRRRRRLWKFAGAEFDEASWTLRVDGRAVTLEGKPLEVLHELLLRAGEVVTKDEILDAVWPGVSAWVNIVPAGNETSRYVGSVTTSLTGPVTPPTWPAITRTVAPSSVLTFGIWAEEISW